MGRFQSRYQYNIVFVRATALDEVDRLRWALASPVRAQAGRVARPAGPKSPKRKNPRLAWLPGADPPGAAENEKRRARASGLDIPNLEGRMRRVVLVLIGSMVAMAPSAAATQPRAEGVRRAGVHHRVWGGVPKPGGESWVCAFADEFNGTSLDRTKWLPQTNFATGMPSPSSRSCHVDHPANVAVRQGALQLTVRRVKTPVVCKGDAGPTTRRARSARTACSASSTAASRHA